MNVYDFDKTIFRGDSTRRFLLYLLRRRPSLLRYVPGFLGNAALFLTGRREKQAFKERMFRAFFGHTPDLDGYLADFWAKEHTRVYSWYAKTRRDDDLVISASPEELVRPCCERLGIHRVMGSPVELATGRYTGANCHGEEKVRRFQAAFPGETVEDFYSDSHSDDPMARVAKRAFLVKGETLVPWTWEN